MRAFTLIEMLIVLGLLAGLAGLTTIAGTESYQRALTSNDLERTVGVLRHARSRAQAGSCDILPCTDSRAQSVRITSEQVFLFEGERFRDSAVLETVPLSKAFLTDTIDIVFLHRSGYLLEPKRLQVIDAYGRSKTITVNEVGMIAIEAP